MSLSVRPRGILGNCITSLIDNQTAPYGAAHLRNLEQVHDVFVVERRVLKINARFVSQSYGIVRLLIDVVDGVGRVVNVLRNEHELEVRRLGEDFFDVGVVHVLKCLPNNQQLSVGQRFIISGVPANKSYVRVTESFGIIIYQILDDVNARVKKVVIVFVENAEHVAHNPKVSATDIDDIANAVVREQLKQHVDIRHDNFFVMRAAARIKFFVGVGADVFMCINVRPNFAVALYG